VNAPGLADIERFRRLVAARLGLHFDDARTDQLADVLARRLASVKRGAASYLSALEGPAADEWRTLAGLVTVPETYFLRGADQFRALAETVVAARTRDAAVHRMRVLSAGCASGEEPYSIAMVLRDRPELAGWDVSVVVVHASQPALKGPREARYGEWSLREPPADVRRRWFVHDGANLRVRDELRRDVVFEERNLAEDDAAFWRPGVFDVVFCRNVLMYFTPEAARAAVARLAFSLAPGGFLFLGHAETLRGLSEGFTLCHTQEAFYYRRRDGAIPAQPHAPAPPPPAAPELPLDASWVDAIQRASARIERLAGAGSPAGTPAAGRASPAPRPPADPAVLTKLLREERFRDALDLLHDRGDGGSRESRLLHAVLLVNGGAPAQAQAVCERILADGDLDAGAHYVLALCREHAGDRAGAQEHDRVAAHLDPAFSMPRLHLGLLARRAGDDARARPELERALELLSREDASRILLFGGGFGREALAGLCRAELRACVVRRSSP